MMKRIPFLLGLFVTAGLALGQAAAAGPIEEIQRYFETGHYAEAIHELEAAIQSSPQDARLHFWLARSAFELLQLDTAVSAAERAVELDPKNSEYRMWLGRAVGRKAERDSSFFLARRTKREFEEAVRLDPTNIRARRDLAEYYSDAPWFLGGSKEKARQQVDAVAEIDPVEGIVARADYFRNIDEPGKAEEQYRLLLKENRARAAHFFEALEFYEGRRNTVEMQVFLDLVAAGDPADPRLLYYFGALHAIQGTQFDEAEKKLRAYLAAVPNRSDLPTHAEAHERLGQIYEQQQKFSAAAAEYRAAVELEPKRKRFREALKRVEKKV